MKIVTSLSVLTLLSGASAFSVLPSAQHQSTLATETSTSLNMFSGAGAEAPKEDDPEAQNKLEAAAKSMGMTVDEYALGMRARVRLTETLDEARIENGDERVSVTRDANNPPRFMEIVISDSGKALGPEGLSKELVAVLKAGSDDSRTKRAEAQKDMMAFVGEEMKKLPGGGGSA